MSICYVIRVREVLDYKYPLFILPPKLPTPFRLGTINKNKYYNDHNRKVRRTTNHSHGLYNKKRR